MSQETPVLTPHAQKRCVEMRIHTRTVKRLWRARDLSRPDPQGFEDRSFVTSDEYPELALIVREVEGHKPEIVTVLWRTEDPFDRDNGHCPPWCGIRPDLVHWHDDHYYEN